MMPEVSAYQDEAVARLPEIPGHQVFSWQNLIRDHFVMYVRRSYLAPEIRGFEDMEVARGWVEEGIFLTRCALESIASAHVPSPTTAESKDIFKYGYRKVADVVGSVARVFIAEQVLGDDERGAFFNITRTYRQGIFGCLARTDFLFNDPVYKDILNGSLDIGLRVNVPPESVRDYLSAVYSWLFTMYEGVSFGQKLAPEGEIQLDFQTAMGTVYPDRIDLKQAVVRMRTRTFSYGKFSIEIELIDPNGYLPTFTLHVSNLDEDASGNFRLGPHHSLRQTVRIPLYHNVDEVEWDDASEAIILLDRYMEELQNRFRHPDRIPKARYVSVSQYVYANLRMIWHALNWPPDIYNPQVSDYIETRTIQNARCELGRLLKIRSTEIIPADVQNQITTLAILCADTDPREFIKLARALGILDVFNNTEAPIQFESLPTKHKMEQEFREASLDWIGKPFPRWDLFQKLGSVYVARLLLGLPEDIVLLPCDVKRAFMIR